MVNYKNFRLSRINEPEFAHIKLLLFWPLFGLMFMALERLFTVDYHEVYSVLDDKIPFCEFFVIPYYFWFVFLIGFQIYAFFFDVPSFKKYMHHTILTYMITLVIYIIYPTSQNLRPQEFLRQNIFTDIVGFLYGFDTNTNVCPSLHVIGSMSVYFAARESKLFGTKVWRCVFFIITVLICASTVFLKQHSIIDIFYGAVLGCICYPPVFMPDNITAVQKKTEERETQYI